MKENPKSRTVDLDKEIMLTLVELLSDRINIRTKITVLEWLAEYLKMFNQELQNGNKESYYNVSILAKIPTILRGILINLSDDEIGKSSRIILIFRNQKDCFHC